ncbi:actin-like protein 6B [Zophobas morio]|uniref:actin-like protein 6B n=1 Tax=Zophobas morio TaxID=2755281 RepID=UPI003082CD70
MSGAIYGGDDVGALVVEVGSFLTKAGYAGEELPSVVIPSFVGVNTSEEKRKYYVGTNKLYVPRPSMEVVNPVHNGEIVDFEACEELLDDLFKNQLRCNLKEHPLMMGDEVWSSRHQREKITELFFEKYEVPAFYLMRKPVLSAFSFGRSAAVVLDIGYSGASASPVFDGFVLNKGVKRSPLGGRWLFELCSQAISRKGIDLIPRYKILKKEPYEDAKGKRQKFVPSNLQMTSSFDALCIMNECDDFYKTICQVSDAPLKESGLQHIPTLAYEFCTGTKAFFGAERFAIPESLFSPPPAATGSESNTDLFSLIANSVESCDVDVRAILLSNIIVTGGVSLTSGLVDRLNRQLLRNSSDGKLKVLAVQTNSERQFSSWIGGSILASLGAFQQKWISKVEYSDLGKDLVEKRCL